MNEYTDLTTLNLDDCNVTYSPYVGKGYPVFIHRTRTIVARDTEDVLIVRFCVAMIPKLEELDRAIEREWSWVRDPLLGEFARSSTPFNLEQTIRAYDTLVAQQILADYLLLDRPPEGSYRPRGPSSGLDPLRAIEEANARIFDDWPDYGAMLVRDVTEFWALPWWRRWWVRLQRYLQGDER